MGALSRFGHKWASPSETNVPIRSMKTLRQPLESSPESSRFSNAADKGGMRKRKSIRRAPSRTYSVYIIELSRACVKQPCALAPVYVGQTAHTPEHRFGQHKAGGKLAASKAHKFGVRLRYDLMKGIASCSNRTEAERLEKAVAEALERRGHQVFWG
jgi:hypothetical protein